jgi:hypothetical protein
MKRWIVATIVTALALTLGNGSSRTRAADPEGRAALPGLEQAINEFWTRWEGAKPSEAIRRAGPTADYSRIWDELGQHSDDFQGRSGGKCLGHSEIARKSLGDNMQYVTFFALYDPTPLRVQLLFYRASNTWTIVSLRIDADPARWLEEAAQAVSPTPPQVTNP